MSDGSVCLTYFSVINTPATENGIPIGYAEAKGSVSVELEWKLYACAPNKETRDKFPERGKDSSEIGWDEYVHTMWTDTDPQIKAKPIADGKIDAKITWDGGRDQFDSSNKDIDSGPNRQGRSNFFNGWRVFQGRWIPR
jgi:hypothetical protein